MKYKAMKAMGATGRTQQESSIYIIMEVFVINYFDEKSFKYFFRRIYIIKKKTLYSFRMSLKCAFISRPGRSQGLLYKHLRDSFIN